MPAPVRIACSAVSMAMTCTGVKPSVLSMPRSEVWSSTLPLVTFTMASTAAPSAISPKSASSRPSSGSRRAIDCFTCCQVETVPTALLPSWVTTCWTTTPVAAGLAIRSPTTSSVCPASGSI